MASYKLLTPENKKQKLSSPAEANENIAFKYIQVQEHFYPQVRFPAISTDGFMLASKDANFFVMGGIASESSHETSCGLMVNEARVMDAGLGCVGGNGVRVLRRLSRLEFLARLIRFLEVLE